jgi:hypothetical protein
MMKPIIGTHPVIQELCKALGIDPDKCRGFELRVWANEIVTLTVSHVEEDEIARLTQAFKTLTFTLSLKDDEQAPPTIEQRRALIGL